MRYGVSPLTPLKGLFIQGPIFVPSFKNGGAYWLVDLSTPDSLYIFPLLTALTFWITVECNMQEGMEGNLVAGTMKNISKAIFCYWITSNIFSFAYGVVIKSLGVKKFLGVLKIPVTRANTTLHSPPFSLSSAVKQIMAAKQKNATSSPPELAFKSSNQRISSNSVLSQRVRNLEKQVKGRKKNKNR